MTLPVPPYALATRVGSLGGRRGYAERFDAIGAASRAAIEGLLPAGWSWEGKRVLDFGCGVGRTLRHFEGVPAEFVGSDIDAVSVDWINRELPFTALVNGELPPIDQPDGSFDLIYAMSVFTHLGESWSRWLLELRRLLRPDGLLVATYLGPGMSEVIAGEPWDEDRVGMNILRADQSWDRGGPSVLLSQWWLREHWGRAFDLLTVQPATTPGVQSLVLATPNDASVTPDDLEATGDDPREIAALRHNVRQVNRDLDVVQRVYEESLSWRLTTPLRRASARLRNRG